MRILLVGTGGFASGYIKNLMNCAEHGAVWEGAVDPYIQPEVRQQLAEAGVPVYDTMEAFYADHGAELAIVCTPTLLHREHCICAMAHGSHVLCEKPAAPTEEDAQAMIAAQEQYGRFIAIGFQWSYANAIQALKRDVLSGALGKPVSLKTAISWPRKRSYYQRGIGWGGRIQKDGKLVLDSIASNACAHYLHNMLFVLGDAMDKSASVSTLQADCLRANEIENFDTCTIRAVTENGTKLYFAASHATGVKRDPEFVYDFEQATVYFEEGGDHQIRAVFRDGTEKCYGDPFKANDFKKLWDCVEAARTGVAPVCTVQTALPHVALIEKLYQQVPVQTFPVERVYLNEEKDMVCVEGLYGQLYRAYEEEKLLSEL